MRLCYLSTLALATACGGHQLKREILGGGTAYVQPRGAPETLGAAPPASIAVRRGTYEVKLRFDVPRAQVVEWTVLCPGSAETGMVGETADQYRARRIAELRADRQRDHDRVAAVSGMLIGAVAPDVHAHAHAGNASADATVSGPAIGAAAGNAIADATVSDVIELAPGDVGAATLKTKITIATLDSGVCSVSAIADDATVAATFELVRVRDLAAEARARDPKLQARIAVQARLTGEALGVRGELVRYLTGECHARPDHRRYLREEPLVVRAALRDYLVSLGAHVRPPMPPPKPETPGSSPYDDGEWISGHWMWTGVEWFWEAGTWHDVAVRDHRSSGGPTVRDHRSNDSSWTSSDNSSVRDHRSNESTAVRDHRGEPTVRDHRSETKSESKTVVRDHRNDDDKKDDDKKKDDNDNGPSVRDHRR